MNKNLRSRGLADFMGERRWRAMVVSVALTVAFVLASPLTRAQSDARSGKDVVDTVCAACHATGANGAPRIGDSQAWSVRVSQGLSSLTKHALEGIRKMPAHGGRDELSDLEIARAVTYMVNRSGGNWTEPTSVQELATTRSGEQVVKTVCANCHREGVGGAPKIGDLDAWVVRIKEKKGLTNIVYSAIRGHGAMPPRGGLANLSDAEIRAAILYMFNPHAPAAKTLRSVAAPEPGASDPNHRHVDGISIHVGFVAAQKLLTFPPQSTERTMHGGVPKGSGYYHVNVALVDDRTHAPINDAQIHVQFRQPGLSRSETKLEPMVGGSGNYGNYFKAQSRTRYLITFRISRPGAIHATEVTFDREFD